MFLFGIGVTLTLIYDRYEDLDECIDLEGIFCAFICFFMSFTCVYAFFNGVSS